MLPPVSEPQIQAPLAGPPEPSILPSPPLSIRLHLPNLGPELHLEGHVAQLALPPDLFHDAIAATRQLGHGEMHQILQLLRTVLHHLPRPPRLRLRLRGPGPEIYRGGVGWGRGQAQRGGRGAEAAGALSATVVPDSPAVPEVDLCGEKMSAFLRGVRSDLVPAVPTASLEPPLPFSVSAGKGLLSFLR